MRLHTYDIYDLDGPNNLEIVDNVLIPASLAAGEYVLSWRYDTESTSQVWWVYCSCPPARLPACTLSSAAWKFARLASSSVR